MKLAAHITFYHSPNRISYLLRVVNELLKIDKNIDIYVYTNKKFKIALKGNIHIKIFGYRKFKISRFRKNSLADNLGIKWLVHPFYLAWENRNYIEGLVEEYDVQIYLEDDIEFKKENLEYWISYNGLVLENNYNLGFLRIEKDNRENKFLTDVIWPLTKIVEFDGQEYLLNDCNPYCGFWIYSREELNRFVKSKEWKFDFTGYGVRERAAIGWHGKNMNRYEGTLIPLVKCKDRLTTPEGSSVHHLPNNYMGKGRYCTIEFPLEFPASQNGGSQTTG